MSRLKVFVQRNPQYGKCPQCKSVGTLHRSRTRNMYEQIIRRMTIFKTYRCKECGWRGFRSTVTLTKKSLRQLFIYLSIIVLTIILARYFILNYALN